MHLRAKFLTIIVLLSFSIYATEDSTLAEDLTVAEDRASRTSSESLPESTREIDAVTNPENPIRRLFGGERLDLWSLKRPARPMKVASGDSQVIDQLIRERLQSVGLEPSPEADRRTLIRRLSFDLTGLPPTFEDTEAFVADQSSDAYSKVVERFLSSPHYGERQARWWLDVVRYADTHGYERDEFRPLIWKYRDYVVRAFNENKPYDQFVLEQIAGDELGAVNETDARIATGYLRLGQWDSTAEIFDEKDRHRAEQLADLTNTTASAFLGLTMSCCQCHDHKYDPLSQEDHYRFRAFFASLQPIDGDFMGVTDSSTEIPAVHILAQGDFQSPLEEVAPGFVSVLSPNPADIESTSGVSSGRRLALARWIIDPANPWTSRVFVNRVWQLHFGVGIVATPNDFGYSGSPPTHPELLDWLAVEFVESGWDIRHLHRLIVYSDTYRQSSQRSSLQSPGSENTLLWRQNSRRLDAETLRDSLLSVSGLLKPVDGGKPRWPAVPDELTHAQPAILEAIKEDDGGRMQGWYTDPVDDTDVRSIYLVRKRCLPIPFLQVFDLPDSTTSCARRDTTIVAPQALALLNSPESVRVAESLSALIRQEVDPNLPDDQRVAALTTRCFERVLSRQPDGVELAAVREFLGQQRQQYISNQTAEGGENMENLNGDPDGRAFIDFCRAILNSNEFCYMD